MKYKGDIPLTAYIGFETTVPTDECFHRESKKMFVVYYVIIFACHPELNIGRVIIEHSLTMSYIYF